MLRICRAEDGELFQTDSTLWDIERSGSLEQFLQEVTGIDRDSVLAYLSDGVRLTNENVRELAGATDNSIFVFNKFYLDYDLDDVLQELHFLPRLQSPIEDAVSPSRPSQVATAYVRAAHAHQDIIVRVAASISLQHEALRIASYSLDLNVLAMADTFDTFASAARRELEKQQVLLESLATDMHLVSNVTIHFDFMSSAVRKAIEAGERARTLGDYVSSDKVSQLEADCLRRHTELGESFRQASISMDRLRQGSDEIRAALSSSGFLDAAETSKRRAQDLVEKITDVAAMIESPASNSDGLMQELRLADSSLRRDVGLIADTKNLSTELCIRSLRQISVLNIDLVQLPGMMNSIKTAFRSQSKFPAIMKVHNMLYAYGATLIEIVRRKDFARFVYQRAETILEVMARLSSTERKRRQIYRSEVHGQLPFATKGMDEPVPAIDFTPTGSRDFEYTLERVDVDAFMDVLDNFEHVLADDPHFDISSLVSTREALEKLIVRMDSLESTFDRIMERSVLSASRLSQSRRRLIEADELALQDLSDQLAKLQQEKSEEQSTFESERSALKVEIARLQQSLQESSDLINDERARSDAMARDMRVLQAQYDSDASARKVLEQRHAEMLADIESLRQARADALSTATERAKETEQLRHELVQTKADFEEVKQLEAQHSQKIAQLLEDQTNTLCNLEEARLRGEDLEAQIRAARTENEDVSHALRDASEQKDRLLRAQALEHDRIMRDHIAEADGDRAVLEHQLFEAKALMQDNERQLKEARSEIEVLNADAAGLREELQRTEHELREARHVERVLRGDLSSGRASQTDYERRIQDRDRLIAQILDVAINFRDSHAKAFAQLHALSVHPSSNSRSGGNLADSMISPPLTTARMPMSPLQEEASPIDPTDPAAALEILRSYDMDVFSEIVAKVGSTNRKWQKQCKDYRERAKGKISFRNFQKGDLALFLPTRNSISKPWAAFNVSFPHYFLQASGRLAEQLKTREWIVARITSITERVVDIREPSSNPYGLGDGIKYYMLEVEDWTQPGSAAARRRRVSAKPTPSETASSPPRERPISPPPAEPIQANAPAAESLGATHSPTSHLFPVRTRSNSTSAGPSSLSKLLAQAGPSEGQLGTSPSPPTSGNRSPSPVLPPPLPSPTRQAPHTHSPSVSSPLRPGSRASSSSRLSFSGGRIPLFSNSASSGSSLPKAAPTTALSSEVPLASPSASASTSASDRARERMRDKRSNSPLRDSTPSPTHSATDGLASVMQSRRRTTSEHVSSRPPLTSGPSVGTSATNALATIASWSASLGRRKRTDSANPITNGALDGSDTDSRQSSTDTSSSRTRTPASELLKRF